MPKEFRVKTTAGPMRVVAGSQAEAEATAARDGHTVVPTRIATIAMPEEFILLLQDALAEYMAVRGPAVEVYVSRRYDPEHHSPAWLREKAESVRRRMTVAALLRGSLFCGDLYSKDGLTVLE